MKGKLLEIKENIYSNDLLSHLNQLVYNSSKVCPLIKALQALCLVDIFKENKLYNNDLLTDDIIAILDNQNLMSKVHNKEIVARWCDYLQEKDNKNRPALIKQACSSYVLVYESTKDYEYLIRSLRLIRKVKGVFQNELEDKFKYYKTIIIQCKLPFWQMQLLKEMSSIFNGKCKLEFTSILKFQLKDFDANKDFENSRFVINSLKEIGSLNANEWHIHKAISFEKEGDKYVENKVPNTFYPNISKIYKNGLQEIKSIGNCEDLKQRLERKLSKEMLEDFKMISICGVKISESVDYEKIQQFINCSKIRDFDTAFHIVLNKIPIIPNDRIKKNAESKLKLSESSKYFSSSIMINEKGCEIGSTLNNNFIAIIERQNCRKKVIAFIKSLKSIMDHDKNINKHFISELIENSKFIPDERKYIFIEGLYAGFNNDFILASHLLIPQFENSFKFIAKQNGIITTQLEKEKQFDNLLGGILEKLNDIIDSDLKIELKNFLIDSNDINFRNELCHGLMNPIKIQAYGIYLWWLSLKMITQTEKYFKFKK